MIDLIRRFWPALAALAWTAAIGIWAHVAGTLSERATWEKRWSDRNASDALATAAAERKAREDEQAAQAAMNEVQADAAKRIEEAEASAGAAGNAADRLRGQVDKLLAADAARRKAGACTGSHGAESPGNLLAVVLDKSVQRNRELAAIADRALIAAQSCEAAWAGRP